MKQKVIATIEFFVDEEDENANYEYAKEILCEMEECARLQGRVVADFDLVDCK